MTKRKKIFRILIVVAGVLLILLVAFQLIVPKLINLESIKEKILAGVSAKVGGEVKCGKVELSLFPYPHAVINEVSLSIPGKVSGSLDALSVYPKILPLFGGKLYLSEIQVERPDFKVNLPEKPEGGKKGKEPTPAADVEKTLSQALAPLALDAPDLVAEVENGTLDISKGNKSLFSFRNINTHIVFPPEGFRVKLTCASNLWESLEVKGTLDSEHLTGEGRAVLMNFQPHKLTTHLIPDAPQRLIDSLVNLSLGFKFDGLKVLKTDLEGSFPLLAFKRENRETTIKGKSLKAALNMHKEKIAFSLHELSLDYPQLTIAANFLLNQGSPRLSLELQGTEIDVPSTRKVALALAGDVPDVQEIFGIVRGGKVPLITFKSEGSTYDHLSDIKNILIKGNIVEGKILVPDVELDLADVKGDTVISEGVLHGENLEARVGNSWGRGGKLKLGLAEDDDSFHLDIGVEADLAELPPIMKRLIEDKVFEEEMKRIEDLKGNAKGRLVLGETTESIKARVDVSKLNLSAKYQRVPYPLEIGGGHFYYDGTNIGVKSLSGKLGNTSFKQLSASIDLEKELYLDVKSADINFADEEIYTWLTSIEGSPLRLENIKSVKGYSHITALELKGPLLSPGKWLLKTAYEPRHVVIDSTLLPGPIEITKGKFKGFVDLKTQELSFRDVQIRMLDASMNVSGAAYDYLKGLNKVDLSFKGVIGPESDRWMAGPLRLPPMLALRPPISVLDGRLLWEKDAETSAKLNLALPGGENVSIDVFVSPEEFRVKNALIRDEVSRASFGFNVKERELGLRFSGNLEKSTFNNLFVEGDFVHGRAEGDFQAHISLDHPMKSTAQGHLMGENLIFPRELKIPLELDQISLKAEKRHVDVERATLVSGSQKMDLEGSLDFSPPGLVFNMDVKSNGISWTDIEELLGEGGKENESEQGKASWDLPIQGTVKLESEYFNYERFTWIPFHADITFAQDEINVSVIEAKLCNISTPGTLKVTPKDLDLDFQPIAKNKELQPTIHCIKGEEVQVTGNFDLEGKVTAKGKPEKIVESLEGNFELLLGKGRIHRHVPMEKLLAYLNVLGIIKGQLSEMKEKGFAYDSISAKADIQNGKIVIREGIIDGLTMDITTQGNIDLVDKKIDLTVLVAPMKTLDTILKKIPIIKTITKEGLITVAVKVEGDLGDPKYRTLPASAVGSGLVGMMKRIVKLPFQVIDVEPTGGAENIPFEPNEPEE